MGDVDHLFRSSIALRLVIVRLIKQNRPTKLGRIRYLFLSFFYPFFISFLYVSYPFSFLLLSFLGFSAQMSTLFCPQIRYQENAPKNGCRGPLRVGRPGFPNFFFRIFRIFDTQGAVGPQFQYWENAKLQQTDRQAINRPTQRPNHSQVQGF